MCFSFILGSHLYGFEVGGLFVWACTEVRNSSTVRSWLSQNCRFMLVAAGSNGRSHLSVITGYYVSSSAGWAHYWLLGVRRRASRCVLCLSCRRALRVLRALLSTTARSFRIVDKLRGNLFIADQSRAASHSPSHYTLLAPRTLPWPRYFVQYRSDNVSKVKSRYRVITTGVGMSHTWQEFPVRPVAIRWF